MTISKNLTKTIAVAMLGTALATGVTATYMPSHVEAYAGITSEDERQIGWASMNQEYNQNDYEPDKMLTEMAKDIVANSNGDLNFNDGQHKRWLNDEIYRIKTDEAANAHCYPGGFIMVNQSMIDLTLYHANDGSTWKHFKNKADERAVWSTFDIKEGGLYPQGMLYATVGHEIGHYANEDYNRIVGSKTMTSYIAEIAGVFMPQTQEGALMHDSLINLARLTAKNGYSKSDEYGADKKAMEYLSKSEYFGVGDFAMLQYRTGNKYKKNGHDPSVDSKSHPAHWNRIMKASEKIKEMSGGLLEFRLMTPEQKREDLKQLEAGGGDNETNFLNKMASYNDENTGEKCIPYARDFMLYIDGRPLDWTLSYRLGTGKMQRIIENGETNKQGFFPANMYGTAQDRTFHIAGQIASAIELGIFNKKNLKYMTVAEEAKLRGDPDWDKYGIYKDNMWLYFEGVGKDGKVHRKFIDLFDLPKGHFVNAKKTNNAHKVDKYNPLSPEMAIVSYITELSMDIHYNDPKRSWWRKMDR